MTTLAKHSGAMPVEDPFVSASPSDIQRHRYSGFDANQFSLHAGGSPSHIKRALEAHLAETDRRLQDASQIGSVLVKQRQDLAERIRELDTASNGQDIPQELRQKVAVLEKEVAEISRETARIFVPKGRIPSGEATTDPSDSILSSHAQHSPTKVHAPASRKARNQPQTRLNDVKLATALTDTLLIQMRDLQAAYAEREEALKHANQNNTELETDLEALRAKLRALDDSEQRFKDENWSLETQVSDLLAVQKEASDREQKLTQSLNVSKSQYESMQREFDDLKQSHTKLTDEHSSIKKQHDLEVVSLRRNVTTNESEVDNLRKRVDDLTSQNKELAKAFTARLREGERAASQQFAYVPPSADDDQRTPENSPPPSPSKGTPRHGALESETLKSSLHHAQRMIQHLKNNIHREKTEKFELKKLLQEARDDLETKRKGDSGSKAKRQSRQIEAKKQPRPDRLGAARSSKDEIFMDDHEWEDGDVLDTPSKAVLPINKRNPLTTTSVMPGGYADTATEASDAFETANENNTETEAFQTGVETLDGNSDEDELTETEQKTPTDAQHAQTKAMNRYSFHSTASTSDDEDSSFAYQTPLHKAQTHPGKTRVASLGHARSSPRSLGQQSVVSQEQSPSQDSPASLVSSNGTPVHGKSLFAELDGLSDDGTEASSTPQSQQGSPRFSSPQIGRKSTPLPSRLRSMESYERPATMIDAGTMTEDLLNSVETKDATIVAPDGRDNVIHTPALYAEKGVETDQTLHTIDAASQHTEATEHMEEVKMKESVLLLSEILVQETLPVAAPLPPPPMAIALVASDIVTMDTSPFNKQIALSRSEIVSHETTPVEQESPKAVPYTHHQIVSVESEPVLIASVPTVVNAPEVLKTSMTDQSTETEPTAHSRLDWSLILSQDTLPLPASRSTEALVIPQAGEHLHPSTMSSEKNWPGPSIDKKHVAAGVAAVTGLGIVGTAYRRKKERTVPIIVAEDDTSQPLTSPETATQSSDGQRTPLQSVDSNVQLPPAQSAASVPAPVSLLHESTQTKLSGADIENLFDAHVSKSSQAQQPAIVMSGDISPRKPRETIHRPGSSSSSRSGRSPPPPLPAEAKTVIAAQRASIQPNTANATALGSMGPPIMPASAYKRANSNKAVLYPASQAGHAIIKTPTLSVNRSGVSSPMSRRSSASSFASELDHRFNMAGPNGTLGVYGTDPRMLRALTETMLGEPMHKYTSGSGKDGASNNRHQRFFWVHPYTLTLYWSSDRPQESNKKKGKASAVSITSVRSVQDDNPNPPGLHNKSILIATPHRTIKMTAPTAQRHETWVNALSYLLLKQNGKDEDDEDITAEDLADFDPNVRSSSRTTQRSRATVSTRASRSSIVQHPTLRPVTMRSKSVEPSSISSRLTAVFRTPQSFRGSRSSRYSQATHSVATNTGATPHDTPTATTRNSAEETRRATEAQEKEAFRMENVRACCDGKHDVGSLSRVQPPSGSRSNRVSFGPSISGSTSTVHRRQHSDSKSLTRRQHLEMDPANIVGDE